MERELRFLILGMLIFMSILAFGCDYYEDVPVSVDS